MACPAWFHGIMSAIAPTSRFSTLFSMSDRQLANRGYDRDGLQRSFIAGLGGF